jgi:NADPH-dependent ferric siderophore reductase
MNDLTPAAFPRSSRMVWPLTVVDAFYVTPRKRRVRLVSELDGFSYRPGQSLLLTLPHAEGALRHFSVRDFDPVEERLDIDFVLRGESPATDWVRQAKLGDSLVAEGQRRR